MYANVYGSRKIQKHDADFKSEPPQMRYPLHLATILYVQVRGLDFKAVPFVLPGLHHQVRRPDAAAVRPGLLFMPLYV